MSSIGLYYPWMHFQDDNWVKLALLTWDNMVRMRPAGLEDRDDDLVRQVRAESDFLTEVAPSGNDLAAVTTTFREVIDAHLGRLVDRYAPVNDPHAARMPPSNRRPGYIQGPDDRRFWIYCGSSEPKMDNELRDLLLETGLAVDDPGVGPEWIGTAPKLGLIYNATLADAVADHNSLSPVTDDPTMHRAVGALDCLTEILLDGRVGVPAVDNVEHAYFHVSIDAVIEPRGLSDLPAGKLIAFRHKYSAELAAFRKHIADLGSELQVVTAIENPAVAHAHLRAVYGRTTRPQLDELRRALRGAGVESTTGALGLKVDLNATTGTILGSVAALGGHAAVAGAAIAVTVLPYVAGKIRVRRQRAKDSPVAYLLAADRTLGGTSLLGLLH